MPLKQEVLTMFAYINTGLCYFITIAFFVVRNHPNGVCGFRVPCTLEHPAIWKKTHIAACVAGLPCCLLDLFALLYLPIDRALILSWVGIFAPIGVGCITAAILQSRQDKQQEQREEQQRKAAEREESSPKF